LSPHVSRGEPASPGGAGRRPTAGAAPVRAQAPGASLGRRPAEQQRDRRATAHRYWTWSGLV